MRLADVLSKPINQDFIQVEGFLENKRSLLDKPQKLSIGRVALNFYCKECEEMRTFCSREELYCIVINNQEVSIDCVLECPICKTLVPMWFLVESDGDISMLAPTVRIIKCEQKLSDKVLINKNSNEPFFKLVENAERAYRSDLGAGAIVYLRIALEQITKNIANTVGISLTLTNNRRKPFKNLLEEVDRECAIVPREFSENGYRLFEELSECAHGNCDEQMAINKYEALKRLITGIIDNVKNKEEITSALESLNWNDGGENVE